MICLILAAGFGTRLYPKTINLPKALLRYKSKPIISHIVERIPDYIPICVACNRKFETDFKQWLSTINRHVKICVEDVLEKQEAKGAIGSLLYFIDQNSITDDLLVIAADNYFEFDLNKFILAYNNKNILIAVYDIKKKSKAGQFGVVELDRYNHVVGLEEKPSKPKSSIVSTAIYLIPPSIFPHINECYHSGIKDNLGHFISFMLKKDIVKAYYFNDLWFDISNYLLSQNI